MAGTEYKEEVKAFMEEEDPQKRVHDKGGGIRRVSQECPAEECWLWRDELWHDDEVTLHGDESASSSQNLRLSIDAAVRQGNLSEVARLAAEVVKFAKQGKTNEVRRLRFSAETDDFGKSSSSSMFDEVWEFQTFCCFV
jgi:hypothetical protein